MSIINNNLLLAGTDEAYNLTRSLRFRSSASAYLSRTIGTPTNNKIFTVSTWVKRGLLGTRQGLIGATNSGASNYWMVEFDAGDALTVYDAYASGTTALTTSQVFRDPSAWYHIVVAVDTTQATASNRTKVYVNGSQVTAFSVSNYPSQNSNSYYNTSGSVASIGSWNPYSIPYYFDGYRAETISVDGQQLTPSSFGETDLITGVWKPKRYAGTYGTNGFYLPFTDNSALTTSSNAGLGKDFSGNGNYWTTNNISITSGVTYDSMTDVPTLTSATAANFAVLNPLSNSTSTLSNANLSIASASGNANTRCNSTIAVSSGKWYYEIALTGVGTNSTAGIGQNQITNTYPASDALSYAYELDNARIGNNNSFSSYGSALVLNDIFMCAFDLDNNKIFFGKNGTWFNSSDPAAGTSPAYTLTAGTYCPIVRPYNSNLTGASFAVNFGQRPFTYTPPTGYVALNTYNLPTPTILQGNTVFDVNTWTGNGTSQTITNSGSMKPDFFWMKSRSVNGYYHVLMDSVRGITKALYSNATDSENTLSTRITSINSNGFTVGSSGDVNDNAQTFVGWQWQAGQGTTSTNTSGSITSTVSVNATAGFSVVTWAGNATAGATVGHGLGVTPKFFVVKRRDSSTNGDWFVYSETIGNTKCLFLNLTDASTTASAWNNTSPTSSVFSLGSSNGVNGSGATYVAYCFAPIAGYSAFGSYSGNNSSDGPFVYTGFRPKFIMRKGYNTAGVNWSIIDTSRNTYNLSDANLFPNLSNAESVPSGEIDILSNGFKMRSTSFNASGVDYIYMAFAEVPTKFALAR